MERLVSYAVMCLVLMFTATPASAQGPNPCEGDIARFCGNIQPGNGRIADCLKQNEGQLSPECRMRNLAEVAEVLRKAEKACGDDSVKFCGSQLQNPGYGLLNCLKLNAPSLSPGCRAKLFEALDLMAY